MKKTSVVIRCYNEEEHIGRLLSGIIHQDFDMDQMEIIIVDSGSNDATIDIASKYPTKIVTIDSSEFTFGRALNLGCQESTGDFLIFASAHIYPVYKDWIKQMILPFRDEKVGLVYGKQRGNHVTKFSEHRVFAKWFPDQSDFNQSHTFSNNANAAIRKELWQNIRYDETLTGLEDLDWSKKIFQLGYKIVYNAKAEIIHVHDESFEKVQNRYLREAFALKKIYPEQKFSFWDFVKLFTINSYGDFVIASKQDVLLDEALDILRFRWNQFFGTYKGYRLKGDINEKLKKRFYYPERGDQKETQDDMEHDSERESLRIGYGENL